MSPVSATPVALIYIYIHTYVSAAEAINSKNSEQKMYDKLRENLYVTWECTVGNFYFTFTRGMNLIY